MIGATHLKGRLDSSIVSNVLESNRAIDLNKTYTLQASLTFQVVINGFEKIRPAYGQGRIREEGMQQPTSKNRMGGGMLLEKYSNI